MAFVVSVDWIFSAVVVVVVPMTWMLPAFLDLEAFLVGVVSAVSYKQDDPLCCRKNISHSFTFYTSKEKLQASLIVQRRGGTSMPVLMCVSPVWHKNHGVSEGWLGIPHCAGVDDGAPVGMSWCTTMYLWNHLARSEKNRAWRRTSTNLSVMFKVKI